MSNRALDWAFAQDIPTGEKFVLVALANRAHEETHSCYPSQEKLARDTGQTERSVRRHLDALAARGLILRQRRHTRDGYRSSDLIVLLLTTSLADTVSGRQDDLPETVSAPSRLAEPALPDTVSARESRLPETVSAPTGQKRQRLPDMVSGDDKGSKNPKGEPKGEPKVLAAAPRARNPVWDALAAACGTPATKDEQSDFGKTVAQLVTVGAAPEQIAGFAAWWFEKYPDAMLTHRCYRRWWGQYTTAPPRPAGINDLKNPMLRAIMTNDLSDIEAELEAKHGPSRHLQAQDARPRQLPADTRGLAGRGDGARDDVLPAPRRPA